jgi:hypothetical protein
VVQAVQEFQQTAGRIVFPVTLIERLVKAPFVIVQGAPLLKFSCAFHPPMVN